MQFLFSFHGRLNRAPYWYYNIVLGIIFTIVSFYAEWKWGWFDFSKYKPGQPILLPHTNDLKDLFTVIGLAMLIPSLAIAYEDCTTAISRAGWWYCIFSYL
jgi:uncharacterized membrane protein YhaH (DUF805 family)